MCVLAGAGRNLWRSGNFGHEWEISYTFDEGEYIQAISPMDKSMLESGFLLVTVRAMENTNRVYYSDDAGKEWVPKIDTEFSPYLRASTTEIKVTGQPDVERNAILSGMTTPIPLTGTNEKRPKVYQTVDGLEWSETGFIWPEV
jgi:hypothetical protein